MRNRIVKTISLLLVSFMFLSLLPFSGAAADRFNLDGQVLSNEYLAISVDPEFGCYTIGTTGGNPDINTDNNKKMLYGYPDTGTSYTTVVINGNVNIYGNGGFTQSPEFNTSSGNNISVASYGNIVVKQILQIVQNNSTNRKDVVEIKYEIKNTGTSPATIGTRIMLDTMLGDNDHAPFRIPDIGAVTTQTEFTGNNIPQYWQAFDSLTDPKVVAQGSFLRSSANKPDKVQFTNWGNVFSTAWNCPVNTGSANGDSAVTVTWNEKVLAAGETRTYTTHYGLSELVQDVRPPLAISLYGDSTIYVENGQYSPNPINITAYLQNIGNGNATNAYARIECSGNLTLSEGQPNRFDLGTVAPGEVIQSSWSVIIGHVLQETSATITVIVGADGLEEKSLSKQIITPVIPIETDIASIKITVGTVKMRYKDTYELRTIIYPRETTDTVVFASSDEKVVTVDDKGVLTSVGRGFATITATTSDGTRSDTCEVEVFYAWWQWLIAVLLFGWIWY